MDGGGAGVAIFRDIRDGSRMADSFLLLAVYCPSIRYQRTPFATFTTISLQSRSLIPIPQSLCSISWRMKPRVIVSSSRDTQTGAIKLYWI